MSVETIQPSQTPATSQTGANKPAQDPDGLWGEDGFTFGDVLDIVNPLQHIPVVSKIYQSITGDTIADAPKVLGGALFGGVAGFVTQSVNSVVRRESGKDIEEHILALFQPEMDNVPAPTEVAQVDDDDLDEFFAEMDDDWSPNHQPGQITGEGLLANFLRALQQPEQTTTAAAQRQAVSAYEEVEQAHENMPTQAQTS